MALNIEKLAEYADIYLQRKYHQEKDRELTEKLNAMEQGLIDHMANAGVDKVSLTGGRTIVINEQIWPKYGDKSIAIKALKEAGIVDMVEEGFNHNRLAAYIRELIRQDQELPDAFKGKIKPHTVQKLVARKL